MSFTKFLFDLEDFICLRIYKMKIALLYFKFINNKNLFKFYK
ncbi:hypothetical protein ATCC51562_506 [Campylobacter concisus ATCC 51562]|uniref:Uncharacterized protein n=1 Tax=Campylobacter concisus ATCC 51562 TaxID=1242969 RepID=U2F8F8_9BACT|nr:hypothetical protein ATCC51562_506 [Campylobacter concisus ATCC 51562]